MSTSVTSIDPNEVEYYDRLADTWWDESGPFWPLHRLNKLRTRWITERLCERFDRDATANQPLRGLRVLDIGCGGGILSFAIAEAGASVHGVDVTERNIEVAQRHLEQSGSLDLRFDAVSAEELAASGARYDAVLSMEVVEHVADLPAFMDANCTLVRPGGQLYLSTINRTLRSFLFAIIGAEYVLGWLPRGTHQWRRFPKPAELADLLNNNGLVVADETGVGVNPLTRRFKLISSLSVNYMLLAQHAQGEQS